ncbi:PHP domain-containing protein [Anaerocolumna sp. MB42-C2]|uniref:PHP domain-containing protein n=1 Tax=Anaerocolumna sp. MB42-C2 TaxID=3070997 RepID=UPI0027E08F32|nr:PHP domain-containing protein [Anaerocolumna sp. MB42-C2]WMJ85256.1 PHP domain-containing protein [Anaerocolumna sp. MB42-C2]
MLPITYDLHIHSCLSPCGDSDMTPGNIVGMALIKQLDVIALTDHNSCKNCPAFLKIAMDYGITAIPGMELCTAEEVHVVCLFPELKDAMSFDEYVYSQIVPFPNEEAIFGKQEIVDESDEVIGTEPNLLINATNISFDQVYELTKKYNGIMIPAHIDKSSNSLLSNLGFIPPDSKFSCVELKDLTKLHELKKTNPYLEKCKIISSSDAHYLEHMNEPVNYLHVKSKDVRDILEALQVP